MGPIRFPDLTGLFYWAGVGILLTFLVGVAGIVTLAVWLFHHLAWV